MLKTQKFSQNDGLRVATLAHINVTSIIVGVVALAALVGLLIFTRPEGHASAQSSCSPSTDFGLVTKTVSIDTSGTYRVWSRVKASDGNPTYVFHIDGSGGALCNQTVATSGTSSQWVWVQGPSTFNWSGGSATVYLSGNKADVGLDCVVLTTDTSFSPSTAADCASSGGSDTVAPTVQLTTQNNALASNDTFTITANADDNVGVDRVEIYIDSELAHTDSSAPYTYTWPVRDPSTPNADYSVTATAYDTATNQQQTPSITIRVRHPDMNRSNSVDIFDLSRLLSKWSTTNSIEEDLNANGSVDIFDLSILLSRWAQ